MFCSRYDHQTEKETLPEVIRDTTSVGIAMRLYRMFHVLTLPSLCDVVMFAFDLLPRQRFYESGLSHFLNLAVSGSNQAYRAISTSQLNALPHLHLWPIDVVVFHGSQGRPCFEGGFPLRCLQRLSCPFIATQHYHWHDNWSTSGTFTPVLSY